MVDIPNLDINDEAFTLTEFVSSSNDVINAVNNLDVSKAANTYVNTQLNTKASLGYAAANTYVNTQLNTKASLGYAAANTYVNSQLSDKVTTSTLNAQLATKASLGYAAANTYVNAELAGKQPTNAFVSSIVNITDSGFIVKTGTSTSAARQITAGTGIAITNPTGAAANPIVSSDFATITQLRGKSSAKTVSPDVIFAAAAWVGVTYASSITLNLASGFNFTIGALTGNLTLANFSGSSPGQSGTIIFTQDGTGGRTISFGSAFKFPSGIAPTMSTGANTRCALHFKVVTTTNYLCSWQTSI